MDVIERGDIAFFVRPRVQPADLAPDAPPPPPGVQRFFVVLSTGRHHRRLKIGKKHLPERRGQRFWALVERVGTLEHVVADQLEPELYATRTRGERYQPPARPIAQGEYALVRHDTHTHLVYRVDATGELDVAERGSFVLLFKHPRGRARWTADVDARAELDVEDAELVLIAGGDRDASVLTAAALPAP